jgi:hypothetical protein
MKTDTVGAVAERPGRAKLHNNGSIYSYRSQFVPDQSHSRSNSNLNRTIVVKQQVGDGRNAAINSLWICKVGDRILGTVGLVQDSPQTARIILFRIDPEWRHTKVPMNLIHSIERYCQNHGGLLVTVQPHAAPSWIMTLMNRHGFQSSDSK